LENLKKEIQRLEAEIRKLRKQLKTPVERRNPLVYLVLEKIFIPYFEGVAEGLGLTLEDTVKTLIEKQVVIDTIIFSAKPAYQELIEQPEVHYVINLSKIIAARPDDWFVERTDDLLEILEETRPEVAEAIKGTPGGVKWLTNSLLRLKRLILEDGSSV